MEYVCDMQIYISIY